MARTKITVTAKSPSGIAPPAAQNADAANGMYVDRTDVGGEFERLELEVINGGAGAIDVTLVGGTSERNALRHGLGNLVVNVPAGATRLITGAESARFTQDDGDLYVDFSGATSVTLRAYKLPRIQDIAVPGTTGA